MTTAEQLSTEVFGPNDIVRDLVPQPPEEHARLVAAVGEAYDHFNHTIVVTDWEGVRQVRPLVPAKFILERSVDPYLFNKYVKRVVKDEYAGKTECLNMTTAGNSEESTKKTQARLEIFKAHYVNPFVLMFEACVEDPTVSERQTQIREKVAELVLPSLRVVCV